MNIIFSTTLLALSLTATAAETVHAELAQHIYTYEPSYFALEPAWAGRPANAKFQFSFAFRVAGPAVTDHAALQRPTGWYVAYSQTSFWDLQGESRPFYDSSYRPETWYHVAIPDGGVADDLGLELGLGHESNGKAGADSRSLNHAFVRTIATWHVDDLAVIVDPRARTYLEKADNPDIARYRGYVDLHVALNRANSWGLGLTSRIGSEFDRASVMAELSHPLAQWTGGWLEGFLYVQGFAGWSETLVSYDVKDSPPRLLFGFAITR